MSWSSCLKDWVDIVKGTVETVAILIGGYYALQRVLQGNQIVNLSLKIACDRVARHAHQDLLGVVISLEKGDRSTIQIHDIQVRVNDRAVTWEGREWRKQAYRLSTPDEKTLPAPDPLDPELANEPYAETPAYFEMTWSKRSRRKPFLNFSPGEKTEFANYCQVDHGAVCHIEAAVVGVELKSGLRSQWRASAVSLPV